MTYLKCKKCNDIIFSKNRHDMCYCKCGAIAIDGGADYIRITGNKEDYECINPIIFIINDFIDFGINLKFKLPVRLELIKINDDWYCYDTVLSNSYLGKSIDDLISAYVQDFEKVYNECVTSDNTDKDWVYFRREIIQMVKHDKVN